MRDLPQQMAMQQLQGSGTPVTDGSIQEGDVLSYTMTDGVGKITAHVRPPGAGQMNDDLEAIDGLCAKIIEQRDRIETLEAALKEAGEMWVRKDNRIEQLEAALRDRGAVRIKCSECKAEWREDGDGEIHQHTCSAVAPKAST